MRRLLPLLAFLAFLFSSSNSHAVGDISCGLFQQALNCFSAVNEKYLSDAQKAAEHKCLIYGGIPHCFGVTTSTFINECAAVATTYPADINKIVYATAKTPRDAVEAALNRCTANFGQCAVAIHACDGTAEESSFTASGPQKGKSLFTNVSPDFIPTLLTGVYFGIGAVLVLLVYARSQAIANFIIHGRLPYKLPVYGEDIQSLFKRTQRVNWPAPGSADTELGVLMEPEVCHGETEVYTGVQA